MYWDEVEMYGEGTIKRKYDLTFVHKVGSVKNIEGGLSRHELANTKCRQESANCGQCNPWLTQHRKEHR